MDIQIGTLVTRASYDHDLLFRVQSIQKEEAMLSGIDVRLVADAPVEDLVRVSDSELTYRQKQRKKEEEYSYRLFRQDYQLMKEKRTYETTNGYENPSLFFRLPIKVLHLDGDQSYLRSCIELYKRVGLQVHGVHLPENEMPLQIRDLIKKIGPNIVVITGHDSYLKRKGSKTDLRAYRNSTYFGETVREARLQNPHPDQLVIFAGACQSHFESLIRAGANFASSPLRINIHALDPVYIVAKIAYTSFMESVNVWDAIRNTFTGERGLGGIETKGLHRTGMPYIDLDSDEIE